MDLRQQKYVTRILEELIVKQNKKLMKAY